MYSFRSLILLSTLFGCALDLRGPPHTGEIIHSNSAVLKYFADNFILEANNRGAKLAPGPVYITYGWIPYGGAGCPTYILPYLRFHVIIISAPYFRDLSYNQQEILMYHELGHCLLRLPHIETDGIMHAEENPVDYSANREYYLEMLFNSRRIGE